MLKSAPVPRKYAFLDDKEFNEMYLFNLER